jgi:hypothetical protein
MAVWAVTLRERHSGRLIRVTPLKAAQQATAEDYAFRWGHHNTPATVVAVRRMTPREVGEADAVVDADAG